MQIDAPETRRSLERMVACLTSQRLWQEDLVQEAVIHLWQEEQRHPHQSQAWYLRSCWFHVRNRMRKGRSVDSPRRRNGHVVSLDDLDESSDALRDATTNGSVLESVVLRDLLSALSEGLTSLEREILACVLNGLSTRETARRLHLSHTCVATKRRQIAARLIKLLELPRARGGDLAASRREKPLPIALQDYSYH